MPGCWWHSTWSSGICAAWGYRVTYVRNVTDIDDKIIERANENGEDFRALTQRFTGFMHEDCRALGVLDPTWSRTRRTTSDRSSRWWSG